MTKAKPKPQRHPFINEGCALSAAILRWPSGDYWWECASPTEARAQKDRLAAAMIYYGKLWGINLSGLLSLTLRNADYFYVRIHPHGLAEKSSSESEKGD